MRYGPDPGKFARAERWDGRVAPDARLTRMLCGDQETPRAWSATRLGELAACGFKFFAHRVLALSEDQEQDYELSALEGGELSTRCSNGCSIILISVTRPRARTNAGEVLDALRDERRALARDQGFFDLDGGSIERTVQEFIEIEIADREANPDAEILTEHKFRFALADLNDPKRVRLWLEGRIDRLELNPGKGAVKTIRVIDYKNCAAPSAMASWRRPGRTVRMTDFQLPVYLMGALCEFDERVAANVTLRAGYLVLRNRDKAQIAEVARNLIDPDPKRRAATTKSGERPVAERMIALVDDALAGRFDVDPRQCDDWCPYRSVCRYYKTAQSGT